MNDYTVIHRQGRYSVLAEPQVITLRDGTELPFYRVLEESAGGEPSRFMRAVLGHPLIGSHVFDLRDLAGNLEAEIRTSPRRDEAGRLATLQNTLRLFYPQGVELLCQILQESVMKLTLARDEPEAEPHAA